MTAFRRGPRARLFAAFIVAAVFAGCGADDDGSGGAGGGQAGAAEGREVTVAITPTMPYIGIEDGKLTGLDGELFNQAAENLGLHVKPVSVEFTGLLAGVQAHRYDLGMGNVAWNQERAEAGIFTDPPYYSAQILAERPGLGATTIEDLEGRKLATVQGFFVVPALKEIPGASLQTYPTFEAVLQDLSAGRTDVAFLDPLTVVYQKERNTSLRYDTASLVPPTEAQLEEHPEYSAFLPAMSGWYMNREETALRDALNEQIRNFYADGTAEKLIRKWGGDPKYMLRPGSAFIRERFLADRRKVDRPSGWQPPSI